LDDDDLSLGRSLAHLKTLGVQLLFFERITIYIYFIELYQCVSMGDLTIFYPWIKTKVYLWERGKGKYVLYKIPKNINNTI